jgi:hypothetical protein
MAEFYLLNDFASSEVHPHCKKKDLGVKTLNEYYPF